MASRYSQARHRVLAQSPPQMANPFVDRGPLVWMKNPLVLRWLLGNSANATKMPAAPTPATRSSRSPGSCHAGNLAASFVRSSEIHPRKSFEPAQGRLVVGEFALVVNFEVQHVHEG